MGYSAQWLATKKEDDVAARGSGLHNLPVVPVGESICDFFRTAKVVKLPLGEVDDGKGKKVDPMAAY